MIIDNSPSRRIFNVFNHIFLFLLMVVMLYPVYYVFITSISNGLDVMQGRVNWVPVNPTLATYKSLFRGELLMYMKNSVLYTVVGTAINLVMSCLCAYPLSRKSFSGRSFFTVMVTVTLFFSGGMIPMYLTVRQFGMLDTIWALVLPGAISTYNMIIIRTSFQSIPDALIESAQLDGANDILILYKIVLPLSKAVLSTMLLFYAVTHWNSYFDAMLYLNKKEMYPLQIMLRNILLGYSLSEDASIATMTSGGFNVTEGTIRGASIIITALPILAVYPFVQRYFVKGVMIGSVKG